MYFALDFQNLAIVNHGGCYRLLCDFGPSTRLVFFVETQATRSRKWQAATPKEPRKRVGQVTHLDSTGAGAEMASGSDPCKLGPKMSKGISKMVWKLRVFLKQEFGSFFLYSWNNFIFLLLCLLFANKLSYNSISQTQTH